ncbi:MAG TPA: ABC transporter substrate-binding protein [Gaiellaceae bacterium]|nr:ABC transporter substrate-binding protein [Gaiellaceae bacterium]
MDENPEAARRRPRRVRGGVRLAIEIAAFAVLSIVVLVFIGVVIASGRNGLKPPADTLVIAQTQDFASLDPALANGDQSWELEYATCAKLLDYPPAAGYRGTQLVPEVAASMPRVSADRLTYTLTVRPGWRFSDGSPVTAASFARAFERARSPVLASPAVTYLREVAGWHASGRTLTVHLRDIAPDFVQRLALPYFCAVPKNAPNEQTNDLPSAGPYAVASYRPGRSLLLRRNPYYHGTRPGRPPAILYRFGAYPAQVLLELERGDVDYGVVDAASFQALQARFKADRSRFHVARETTVAYLALNTQRPLFKDNPQLRRAVSYALDRPELARQFGVGGAVPTDEYLPPGFPGYEPSHVYSVTGPDLDMARRLARGHLRGGHAVFLACGTLDCQNRALVVADSLAKIGLHVDIRSSVGLGQSTLASVRGTRFDLADVITKPDYGDPYGLLEKLLDGRAIQSVGNTNLAYFSNHRLDAQIDHAQRLEGEARERAYGRLGIEVARQSAPLAAYAVLNARVFVAKRVGCVTYQPVYGLDLGGVCLKRLQD